MPDSTDEKKFALAVRLGFFTDAQLKIIQSPDQDSSTSPLELASRRGFISRQQLEILDSFEHPESVAPGYRVEGLIGKGGSGVVYLATQLAFNRSVALKTIPNSANHSANQKNALAAKRFEREANIVGQLRHPNIVSAFDFGVHNDHLFLVMEFVDGIDAEKLLLGRGNLSEHHAWYVAKQVCHALSYANELGIIHRDIKPANLILTSAPKGSSIPIRAPFAKVADFGLARFKEQSTENNITLDMAAISGTPMYMSPEQISAKELDHRSDIYSLGVTIWHLISGLPANSSKSPLDIVSNKMKVEDQWFEQSADGISLEGFDLLKTMCRFDREQRCDDYSDLESQIDSVLETLKSDVGFSVTQDFQAGDGIFQSSASVTLINNTLANQTLESTVTRHDSLVMENRREENRRQGNRWQWVAGAAIAVLGLVGLLTWSVVGGSGSSSHLAGMPDWDDEKFAPLTEYDGAPIFLFDGVSVDPRQKFSGKWEVGKGNEKENVLAGNGTREFPCVDQQDHPLELFQFECGFRHQDSDLIEFRYLSAGETQVFHVTITPEESVLFYGESEVGSIELERFDEESFGYHQIHIESQPDHWRALVNAQLIGVIPKPESFSIADPTIEIAIQGPGKAHLEQIRFRQFKLDSDDAPRKRR